MPRPPKGVIPPHLRGFQFKKGHAPIRRRRNPGSKTDPYYGQGKPNREKMLAEKRRADARHIERAQSRKKNASHRVSRGAAIYAHKSRAPHSEIMGYTGHSFSNNDSPKIFADARIAAEVMGTLRAKFPQLRGYFLWVEAPRK